MQDLEFKSSRLSLAPGEVLVFKTATALSRDQRLRIGDDLRRSVGEDVKVLVLEEGCDLAVLTKAQIEARV